MKPEIHQKNNKLLRKPVLNICIRKNTKFIQFATKNNKLLK